MAEKSEGGGGVGGDLFLFVGIFLLFFVIWVAGGGPNRPISFAGPYLRPISGPGQTAEAYGDPSGYAGFSTGISIGGFGANISSGGTGGTYAPGASGNASLVSLVPDPYGAKETDEDKEYLTLNAYGSVPTAGWKLVSKKTGRGVPFPQAAELPQSGRVNVLSPITFEAGDTAIIVSGRSPIGISFKENKCTGYFEERQDFRPPLTQACPTAYQEYERFYDDEDERCLAYLRTIPYCASEASGSASASCEAFAQDYLNYNGCVDAHENDSDFEGRTWRLFLGQGSELWQKSGETVLLLDAEGKVVSEFSY